MAGRAALTFLYGNDEFAIARYLAERLSRFRDPTLASLNVTRLEARMMSEDELNNAVATAPFLAEERLVLLANPSSKYNTPGARKKFIAFLERLPSTTQLVIYESVEPKEAAGHWLVRWAEKNGRAHACMRPRPKEMSGWIVNEAKRQGGAIEPQAAARLAEMLGTDTRQAAQEVSKLLTYVNWARPITLADVEALGIFVAEADVFAMVDALATGDGHAAQELLLRLLESREPLSIWGMVVRQFRLLLQAREVIEQRGDVRQVEQTLAIHPFVAQKVFAQAQRFALNELEKIHHRLLEIDVAVKTSQMTLDLALEMLVVELRPGGGPFSMRARSVT